MRFAVLVLWFLVSYSGASISCERGTKMIAFGQMVTGKWMRPPGNSLPAIDRAYELGFAGIELDIRITKDRVLILMHDNTIDATTNGKGNTTAFTYGELQKFSLGKWKGYDLKIPSLAEALLTNGSRGRVLLDARIKSTAITAMARTVQHARFDVSLLDISVYNIQRGLAVKKALPEARVFLKKYVNPLDVSRDVVDQAAAAGLDGIMIQFPLWNEEIGDLVKYVHSKGLSIIMFVHGAFPRKEPPEKSLESLRLMVDAGVDGVLTIRHDFFDRITSRC